MVLPDPGELNAGESTAPEPVDEPDITDDSASGRSRPTVNTAIVGAATAIFIAALSGAGAMGWLLLQQHQRDTAADQALAAARDYAVTLTSSEPDGADQAVANIINGATGEFKDKYSKVSSQMRKLMIDNQVVTRGTVTDSAIKSASPGKVDVLLVVEQSVTNAVAPEAMTEHTPIVITMEKNGDQWLASKVEVLGG